MAASHALLFGALIGGFLGGGSTQPLTSLQKLPIAPWKSAVKQNREDITDR